MLLYSAYKISAGKILCKQLIKVKLKKHILFSVGLAIQL